jgi:two-component system response regulator RegX3
MADYDVLIVDDEEALSSSTAEYFEMFGVRTAWVASARACEDWLARNSARLVLLDVNLPGATGFQVCKRIRETSDVPILFISARGSDDDVLLALGVGGDDYVRKPYSLSVLLAKANAMLKRAAISSGTSGNADDAAPSDKVSFGGFLLDLGAERLVGPGGEVPLRALEFRLLAYLVKRRGRAVGKAELFRAVWGSEHTSDGTLNVHIRRLREKLGDADARWIRTVWGVGYSFADEEAP